MGGGLTLSHQSHLITMQSRSRTFNDAITVWLPEPVFRSADLIGIRGREGGREREPPVPAPRTTPQSARSPSAIASFIESPPPPRPPPPPPPPLPPLPPPQSSHYRAAIAARPVGDTGIGVLEKTTAMIFGYCCPESHFNVALPLLGLGTTNW